MEPLAVLQPLTGCFVAFITSNGFYLQPPDNKLLTAPDQEREKRYYYFYLSKFL